MKLFKPAATQPRGAGERPSDETLNWIVNALKTPLIPPRVQISDQRREQMKDAAAGQMLYMKLNRRRT